MKPGGSRAKGARVEREAGHYLTGLGFVASRMGRNGYSAADLDCAACPVLSRICLEVKGDRSIGIGTKALDDAMEQAREQAALLGRKPVSGTGGWNNPRVFREFPHAVLWHEHRKGWRLTYFAGGIQVTTAGDARIKAALLAIAGPCAGEVGR